MPSPGEDYQSWSVTASQNGTIDPLINWEEFQTRASVNNSSRGELAAHAKNRNLLNGSIVTTGSPNAQAFISGVGYTSIPTGLVVKLKIGSGLTNIGNAGCTLNMDGIGDVEIRTADGRPLLGKELIGDGYADLFYNGTNWIFLYSREFMMDRLTGGGGIVIGLQKFTTAGAASYTPTPGMECCIVECIGGGGGAGTNLGDAVFYTGAGGGGGGGYSRKLLTATDVGASQPITVGAGGAGSTASGTPGGDGGTTSFGTLCIANGGKGANKYIAGAGASTVGAVGDCLASGSPGSNGSSIYTGGGYTSPQGFGGSSVLGGGAVAPNDNNGAAGNYPGIDGANYGGGGSAGFDSRAGSMPAGGDGAPGVIIVTEFAARGGAGRDGEKGEKGDIGPPGPAGTGSGDVLVHGTPVAGQIAVWFDTSHIQGIDAGGLFSTGDAKITLKTVADPGWVLMDDGTIGDVTSSATTRANNDCINLFELLWNNIPDAWAPVVGGRGASAGADWIAHKQITLPRVLGRALTVGGSGAGLTPRVLGSYLGEETHVLTKPEMPKHRHFTGSVWAPVTPTYQFPVSAGFGIDQITEPDAGNDQPHNNMQPSSFWNVMIKL